MAQFRNSADIIDEVLQKSGEPTNGNSPYEAQALLYTNRAHHAIINGGNIFSYKVDEDWKWARSKNPIVLELEPAFTTGTVTVANGDVSVSFTSAPSDSKEGWYIQLTGYRTVYRITQHTAGLAAATLDSAVMESTGTYTFRCFKLDYEIFPTYLYIDNTSDRLSFEETDGTTLTATLTHGAYSPTNFIAHVITQMEAVGASDYTGTYDAVEKKFTIASDRAGGGGIFTLLGATGSSLTRSALPLLGFDMKDYADAASHESDYIINGISRLVAPFKIYTGYAEQPFIKALDPEELERQHPIAIVEERTPRHFSVVEERADGTYVVRFSSYPDIAKKAVIDWVPVPHDLQDNTASIPRLPRKDIDTLIHAAAAMVCFDKEDSKWEQFFGLTKAGLEAMEKKNRSERFRTGDNFAQITPRQDLQYQNRKLKYGYEYSNASRTVPAATVGVEMVQSSTSYTDAQTGSTTNTITIRSLPANRLIQSGIIQITEAFAGSGISALTADVGISGDTQRFIAGFDLLGALNSSDGWIMQYYPGAVTNIILTITATGANLSALTAGNVKVYFQEIVVEA